MNYYGWINDCDYICGELAPPGSPCAIPKPCSGLAPALPQSWTQDEG